MLKAYFLKEYPLWFAFWGLLTAAERGVLCGAPACRAAGWKQSNYWCVAPRVGKLLRGEYGRGKKRPPPSFSLFFFIVCRCTAGVTYGVTDNYRVLLLLWCAVP